MRPVYKFALGAAGGYAAYTAAVQIEVRRQINGRADLELPEEKYAPIRVLGRWANPFPEYRHQTLFEFGFRRITELLRLHPPGQVPVDPALLRKALPTMTPDWSVGRESWFDIFSRKRIAVTWIGQSCVVAQLPGNVTVLTDPMFSNSVISTRVGPQRLVPPPCTVASIPQPDVVLVSHDHQDHLDLEAASYIDQRATWVVPKGVAKHLPADRKIVEMGWWERIPMPGVDPKLGYEVACTPAMHWSGRALVDSNSSLWCSFLILRYGKPLLFHAGDTGYAKEMFQGIAQKYGGGVRLALLPCGAYLPRWHLKSVHMSPTDALQAMRDLGAQAMIGVHWGTFVMSEEPFDEPPKILAKEAKGADVTAPNLGETLVYRL